ncbi:MAG: M1 family metallopeptidase [candidate division NC10 bacterium]|nr:M1 family metallopeptidase [candidate division NC10 bacterium]
MSNQTGSAYRLPRTATPQRYDLRLEPDLSAFRFTGEERIVLDLGEPAQEIVLNAADLAIDAASIADDRGTRQEASVTLDEVTERVRLRFPEALAPGPWRLSLRFRGILNDQLRGFYRSAIKSEGGGEGGFLAVTQFEATDARRAFPCWDEPAFKAVFQVTLVVPQDLAAISNTGILREESLPGTGKKAVTFAPTIPMSTYLVALVVGRLSCGAVRMAGRTPIRVWCVPGKERLAGFALDVAAFSLRFFEAYYDIPYPGDKLDLIALPDFAFGAMENLGAITFRETALLLDEERSSHAERVRVADVVAHEIAHMWFGDLVTMAWWNGLWLNEAFATLMEVQAVDAWRPAWQRWTAFGVSRAAALSMDGLRASRPVEFEVVAPRDAEAMFDVLTYEKGGAVLRMLEQYLGPERFRAGIRKYLSDHRFSNAETADLWHALGEASGQPIPDIMDGWLFREGYPLVTAEVADDGKTLLLSQERFTYLPPETGGERTWRVPITLRARADGAVRRLGHLLDGATSRLTLPGSVEWAVLNDGGHGFYRVRYGPGLLAELLNAPQSLLAPVERFNLVNDAWAMALAGLFPLQEYLDLAARFRDEADRHVWAVLLASLAYLDRVVRPEDRLGLQRLVRAQLQPACRRLGWSPEPGEDDLARQLRGELLQALGTLGDEPTIQAEAQERYARQRREAAAVDPDLLPALIAIAAHCGDAARYEEFLGSLRSAATPQEEQRFLQGLTGFRDPELVQRTLDLAMGPAVRSQDAPFLFRSLLFGVHSRELTWRFIMGRWPALVQKLPPLTGLRRVCEGLAGLATPELEAEVRAFFAVHPVALGGKILDQDLEQLRVAVRFREREGEALARIIHERAVNNPGLPDH